MQRQNGGHCMLFYSSGSPFDCNLWLFPEQPYILLDNKEYPPNNFLGLPDYLMQAMKSFLL